jgi:hypothetical protein
MYLLIDGHRPRPKPERLRKGGGLGPFERQDKSPHDYSKQLARRALADVERGWYAGRACYFGVGSRGTSPIPCPGRGGDAITINSIEIGEVVERVYKTILLDSADKPSGNRLR